MEAYKFATTVLEHGIIKIPELESYIDEKVDVFVVLTTEKKAETKSKSIDDFLLKWSGFFSTTKTDDTKYNYLMEKYK